MVETGLTGFQDDRYRFECCTLILGKNAEDGIHVAGEISSRKKVPFVASGHVMNAAVLFVRIVQTDPTGQMSDRLCSRPIRIILMPGDDAPVKRGLYKKL